jgi:DNA helicase-2/ATP-dependent DNA helicase PcrA
VTSAALDVLAGLDPEQRTAAALPPGPVVILAGAGTGKTRTITHRIAHLVHSGQAQPDQVLAVTFTTRAAGELRSRLRLLGVPGVQARTFHAAARRQLQFFWPRAIGGAMPQLTESKIRLVAEAGSRLRLGLTGSDLRDATSEVEWAKATLHDADSYPAAAASAGREPPRTPEDIGRLMAAYEEIKRRREVLDFDDLLLLLTGILGEHHDVASEVRAQYRHFVVDEYQDVTPLQQALLDAWLGDRDSLTVVGDANQTIYSFTGASPSYLLGMTRRHPDATVVRLVRDYRSTPQVVGLANGVITAASDVPAGARLQLVAQRPDGPPPSFTGLDSEPEEARHVVARVKALAAQGVPLAQMAVLYRIHAQSEPYEAAFADAAIPVVLRGGERFFDRPEIRKAVVLLRGATRGAQTDLEVPLTEQVAEVLRDDWRADAPPAGGGAAREAWDNIAALVTISEGHADLVGFVADLEERAASQHAPAVDGVTLATLHAGKGLEWDAVFLVGLVDGTLPLVHAQSPAQIEEERRLLYVGVTRAREHLELSWAAARTEGGRRSRKRSRFLDGLAPDAAAPARAKPAARNLDAAGEELFGRLRAWRLLVASDAGMPPYIVFDDATLTAICAARPTSRADLGEVRGVGPTKLARYGAAVVALVCGARVEDVPRASAEPTA